MRRAKTSFRANVRLCSFSWNVFIKTSNCESRLWKRKNNTISTIWTKMWNWKSLKKKKKWECWWCGICTLFFQPPILWFVWFVVSVKMSPQVDPIEEGLNPFPIISQRQHLWYSTMKRSSVLYFSVWIRDSFQSSMSFLFWRDFVWFFANGLVRTKEKQNYETFKYCTFQKFHIHDLLKWCTWLRRVWWDWERGYHSKIFRQYQMTCHLVSEVITKGVSWCNINTINQTWKWVKWENEQEKKEEITESENPNAQVCLLWALDFLILFEETMTWVSSFKRRSKLFRSSSIYSQTKHSTNLFNCFLKFCLLWDFVWTKKKTRPFVFLHEVLRSFYWLLRYS